MISNFVRKLMRFNAYAIAPLMIISIGWLTNELAAFLDKTLPESLSGKAIFAVFCGFCLLLAFILFSINVLINQFEKEPTAAVQISGGLLLRIAAFFAFTLLAALTINMVNTQLSRILTANLSTPYTLIFTSFTMIVLFFSDFQFVKQNQTPFHRWPVSLKLACMVCALLVFVNAVLLICHPQVAHGWTYLNIVLIAGYSIYLFFEVTRSFVKPQNKLTDRDKMPGKVGIVTFLSNLRGQEPEPWSSVYQKVFIQQNHQDSEPSSDLHSLLVKFYTDYSYLIALVRTRFRALLENSKLDSLEKKNGLMFVRIFRDPSFKEHHSSVIDEHFKKLENHQKDKPPPFTVNMKNTYLYFSIRFAKNNKNLYTPRNLLETADEMALFFSGNHPWEMTLRSIHHHLEQKTLEKVFFIVSEGSRGSFNSVTCLISCLHWALRSMNTSLDFAIAVKTLNEEHQNIKLIDIEQPDTVDLSQFTGMNFESYEQTSDALNAVLNSSKIAQLGLHNVVVDITSGQKTASVASALAASVSDSTNQYVDTNSKVVKGFDFKYVDPTKTP